MPLDQDENFLNQIRTQLFGNLAHYRQRCINEEDDAKQVARFIEKSGSDYVNTAIASFDNCQPSGLYEKGYLQALKDVREQK